MDGTTIARGGMDLETLDASRMYHVLVAMMLEVTMRDEEIIKAEKKFFDSMANLGAKQEEAFPDDPMGLMTPPIPGLREQPMGLEG